MNVSVDLREDTDLAAWCAFLRSSIATSPEMVFLRAIEERLSEKDDISNPSLTSEVTLDALLAECERPRILKNADDLRMSVSCATIRALVEEIKASRKVCAARCGHHVIVRGFKDGAQAHGVASSLVDPFPPESGTIAVEVWNA